jgi:hypothetical protein
MSQDEADLVSARARRLSTLLRAADPPVPPLAFPSERIARARRRRAAVRWRAAAAVVLVAAGALGVRPVRAWIAQAARAVWTATVGRGEAHGPAASPPAAGGAVSFTPSAGPFVVRVVRPQAGGTLTIETVAADSVTAEVFGGHGGAELVVLPDGLRIVNDSAAGASFVVRVPARLTRIEVALAGRDTRVLVPPPARGPGRWVVDLGAGR